MASLTFCLDLIICISLLFVSGTEIITGLSLDPAPDMAECGSDLLTLVPCAPFVQGVISTPIQACCVNLDHLYNQYPACLCILLDTNNLIPFPINTTRFLQLPLLCNLELDFSTCSGEDGDPPSTAPLPPPVSFGARNGSNISAAPNVKVPPRPTLFGLGMIKSGVSLNRKVHLILVAALALLSIAKI